MYQVSQDTIHSNKYKSTTMSDKESKVRFYKLIKLSSQITKSHHDNYLIIILLNILNEGKANNGSTVS